MSTTSSTAQRGWGEGRVRRARMFAALLALCAAAALWATFQPWFAWATPGLVASCEPAPVGAPTVAIRISDGTIVDGVAARGCVSGSQVTRTAAPREGTAAGVAAAQTQLDSMFNRPAPPALLGLPRTTTVLVGCLGLAVVGILVRRGWLSGIALFVMQVAHQDLADIRSLFLGGGASELTLAMPSLQHYTWALLFGSALTLTATIFVLKVNLEERAQVRQAAREAGLDDPAEPLDVLTTYLGRKIHKVQSAKAEAERVPA